MVVGSGKAQGPIFIGGLAYSGKTPLRLALAQHPELVLTRRTYMWTRYYNGYGDLGESRNLDRCLEEMLASSGIRALQPDPERIRHEFSQGPRTYARLFALFHEQHAERLGKRRWGDQLGFVERYADPIFTAYPAAKMIQMIRDPRDRSQEASKQSRYRKGKVGWSTARWLHSAELTIRNRARYPDRYKVVRYESLMAQSEATLKDVCAFLGEQFLPEMVLGMMGGVGEGQKGDNPENRRNGRISKREVAFIQTCARRHLLDFGYPLESTAFTPSERLLFYLVDWPMNQAGMSAWKVLAAKSGGNS